MANITFIKQEGGLNRPLAGKDHISGLIFYNDTLPSGFATAERIKKVFSLAQTEALGIASGTVEYYHVSEFFRLNPNGELYIGIFAVPTSAYDFAEVTLMQNFASNELRQVGIYTTIAGVVTADIMSLQGICHTLFMEKRPVSTILTFDISGVTDLTTLPDLRTLSAPYVSVLIAEDGAGTGSALSNTLGQSVTCLGAMLGFLALSPVHESIGYVGKYPAAEGRELDTAAFANGNLVKDIPQSQRDALYQDGYTFLEIYTGKTGSYFTDPPVCVASNSDQAFLREVRTVDKMIRNLYAVFINELNAPVQTDPVTGYLDDGYVEYLKSLGDDALAAMETSGEISGYKTLINPNQDVVTSGNVEIGIKHVPTGISKQFTINISAAAKL